MVNQLDEVRIKLAQPEMVKFKPYLNSFWYLTKDEQARVEANHPSFRLYLELFRIEMDLMMKVLMGALEVGSSGLGLALQVEDLSATLKMVTFEKSHIKLA